MDLSTEFAQKAHQFPLGNCGNNNIGKIEKHPLGNHGNIRAVMKLS